MFVFHLRSKKKVKDLILKENNQQIEKPFNNPGWNADTEINLAEVETNDGNYALAEAHLDNAVKIFSENKQLINKNKK